MEDEFEVFEMIAKGFVPMWYELSFRKKMTRGKIRCDSPVIAIRIHKEILDKLPEEAARLAAGDVLLPIQGVFSFGNASHRKEETKETFHELLVPLPWVVFETEKRCLTCGGSGRDLDIGGRCRACSGTGHIFERRWNDLRLICQRLEIVLSALRFVDRRGIRSVGMPQLLTVETVSNGGSHPLGGYALGGDCTPALSGWLSSLAEYEEIKEVTAAMKVAYGYILSADSEDKNHLPSDFHAYAGKNGGFVIQCPGNACTLQPDDFNCHPEAGYKWDCHNVDSPLQQLTLLAGLAALHDKARRAMR